MTAEAAALAAVTVDVTGTLLLPRDLGDVYAEVLGRHAQVSVSPDRAAQAFGTAYLEIRIAGEPFRDPFTQHPRGARGWWGDVIARACRLLEITRPTPFAVAELYDRFRRADAWRVLPGAISALEALADAGLRLGVISDWDERLETVLEAVGLLGYFEVVVRSSEIGWTKPHPAIFRAALERFGVEPCQVLHVGDDRVRDVEGAEAVGMRAELVTADDTLGSVALRILGTMAP